MKMEEIIGAFIALLTAVYAYIKAKNKAEQKNFSAVPNSVKKWIPEVEKYASRAGVPFKYAMGVLWVESAGDPNAIGSAGEHGLYQLKQIAVDDLVQNGSGSYYNYKNDPNSNIRAGIDFLKLQYNRAGTWNGAIRAYNQGFKGMQSEPGRERSLTYLNKVLQKSKFFV